MTDTRSSFLESSFDYRSLLPTRNTEPEEPEDENLCSLLPSMTWRERLMGCGTCMVAGYVLSFGSFWRLADLVHGNPYPFVLNATAGNLLALMGSCFLSGPHAQARKMWQPHRQVATAAYLGSLLLTLIVAFLSIPGPKAFYLLVLMLIQYVAIGWYTLSYIPFAHDAVKSFVQRRLNPNEY